MKTVIILFTISLFCCTSIKANTLSDSYVKNRIYQIASFSNADSSNYKVKVVKSDMEYTQTRFTIVDNHNHPLAAMVWLNDINGKAISSVYGNDDGKISIHPVLWPVFSLRQFHYYFNSSNYLKEDIYIICCLPVAVKHLLHPPVLPFAACLKYR